MFPLTPAEWCQDCAVLHVMNCQTCVEGLGLQPWQEPWADGGMMPVFFEDLARGRQIPWVPCPTCEGTPVGPAGVWLGMEGDAG